MAELRKALSRWDSIAIITAIVIGVGILRVPAKVAGFIPHPALILVVWLLGGFISLLGAICYAELSSSFPKTGGNYVYFKESYGKCAGFLFGWSELLVIRAGSIAALAFVCAEYLCSLISLDEPFVKPAAIAIIIIFSFVNIFGLNPGKRIHNTLTLINISLLVIIIASGLFSQKGSFANFQSSGFVWDKNIFILIGLALIPVLWTFGGWHENTFVAEETKDAQRVIPQALIYAVSFITLLYIAVNIIYIYLIPVERITQSPLIGSDILGVLYGVSGRKVFELMIVIASLGGINAMIITGSRVNLAVAKDNSLFAFMALVGRRFATPHRAIIVNAAWAALLVFFGSFSKLLFFTGILVWFFFGLAVVGVFVLRRKFPRLERPYKAWGYPVTPLVFILICVALFINTLIFYPKPSLIGLGILLTGVPVYFVSVLISKYGRILKQLLFCTLLTSAMVKVCNASEEDIFVLNRERMVKGQIESRGIKDKRVLAAMGKIKRHLFVPPKIRTQAYNDNPLPIGMGQTISQPYIVALMTELLELKGDERVLEIGTGSGYQAAILAELAKEVYTIDILEPLAKSAEGLLIGLGYSNIKVKHGDGFLGWQEFAPFDAIMVTCAPEEVPQALVEQLAEGGRLVIPVGSFFQELKLVEKKGNKTIMKDIIPVRFVPMVKNSSN
ncbi:MAG: protein-L-isoaspartate(D-aspartate) O-methyltransferase [Candidatus Omnitrophica bacterium]|nr:protein-L-isoaspartate(D-aspartate) O-methyltransferase [Candidatus Omnitrophota bacterium]